MNSRLPSHNEQYSVCSAQYLALGRFGAARLLRIRRDLFANLAHVLLGEQVGHLAGIEQIVNVLDERLVLDLRVR